MVELVVREAPAQIEQLVNEKIRANIPVVIRYMPKEEAMQSGAMALFGEKYGDTVRVVSRRGTVVAPAKVGTVVSAGVVFIPFHYGELGEEHAANNLMAKAWDPVSKQPIQKIAAVRLERVATTPEKQFWQDT